jgi:antitoxin component HigA of HigAB toxin-antitoxin module
MLMCDRYESEHRPVAPPDPVSAIQFALDQRAFTTADL